MRTDRRQVDPAFVLGLVVGGLAGGLAACLLLFALLGVTWR